jgi:hypothetical protein
LDDLKYPAPRTVSKLADQVIHIYGLDEFTLTSSVFSFRSSFSEQLKLLIGEDRRFRLATNHYRVHTTTMFCSGA